MELGSSVASDSLACASTPTQDTKGVSRVAATDSPGAAMAAVEVQPAAAAPATEEAIQYHIYYWRFSKLSVGWWIGARFGCKKSVVGYNPSDSQTVPRRGWLSPRRACRCVKHIMRARTHAYSRMYVKMRVRRLADPCTSARGQGGQGGRIELVISI